VVTSHPQLLPITYFIQLIKWAGPTFLLSVAQTGSGSCLGMGLKVYLKGVSLPFVERDLSRFTSGGVFGYKQINPLLDSSRK